MRPHSDRKGARYLELRLLLENNELSNKEKIA